MVTSDELLDLAVPTRVDRFQFDLVDATMSPVGTVAVRRDTAPQVENSINRTIKRKLSNFQLDAFTVPDVDTIGAHVRPMMVLQDGSEWPLGVFLFGDASRPRRSWGSEMDATLVDQCYVLDQAVGRVVGLDVGDDPVATAQALVGEVLPSTPQIVTATSARIGAPIAWPPDTTRMTIATDLMGLVGYLSPYFDNLGRLVLRPVPDVSTSTPDVIYESGGRIIADTIVESDDLLSAPNRYVVIDTAAVDAPIVGTYDVPASAPHSIANRGFPVVRTITRQGLDSPAAAAIAAQAAANSDSATYRWVAFESTLDPRHDTFDVVEYLGDNYREQGWSMSLRAGGSMRHDLRRIY